MNGNLKGVLLAAALFTVVGCGGDDKKPAKKPDDKAGGGGATAPAGGGGTYDAAKSTASIKITATWKGAKPEGKAIQMTEWCLSNAGGKDVPDERFVVNADGTLPHVFVWAFEGPHKQLSGYAAPAPAVLDQKGCTYVPHVFGLRSNQTLTIKNSDGTTHNVHSFPKTNEGFNVAQSAGTSNDFTFKSKEKAIPFHCDIHSWMSAVCFVVDHPFYAATGDSGVAEIKGLPAGDYTFKAWHEGMNAATKEKGVESEFKITLKDGEAATHAVELQ
jgi:hypothetical protein